MPVDRLQCRRRATITAIGDAGEHFDGGEVGGVEAHRGHVGVAVLGVQRGEAALRDRLLAEAAHDADAGQRLLQVAGDRADRLARAAEGAGGDEPEPDAEPPATNGKHAERDQRERDVEQSRMTTVPSSVSAGLEERDDASR